MNQHAKTNTFLLKRVVGAFIVAGCLLITITVIAHKKIKQVLTESSQISCSDFSLNLFTGCLDIDNLSIHIQPKINGQLQVQSSKTHIHGLSYWKYFLADQLVIQDVIFEDVDIHFASTLDNKTLNDSTAQQPTIPEISIAEIQIHKGKLNWSKQDIQKISIDSFSTNIIDLTIQPDKDSIVTNWVSITGVAHQIKANDTKKNHNLFIQKTQLFNDKTLVISDFQLRPKRSKENFISPLPHRKARLDLQIPKISISPFSTKSLFLKKSFITQSITLENGFLNVFIDQRKSACQTCTKTYFYEHLAMSEIPIQIDSLLVKNSSITLEEMGQNNEIGTLKWHDIYAHISDLTNKPETQKSHTHVQVQSDFINDSHVELNFKFPNFNTQKAYYFDGRIDRIDLKKLNQFLTFSKRLQIKDGEMSALTFTGKGDLSSSDGTMKFKYKDLDIALLKDDKSTRKIFSKLVNTLIRNKNNPDENNVLRTGKMYSERRTEKSFLFNWWTTILSGIKSTVLKNIVLPEELEAKKIKQKQHN